MDLSILHISDLHRDPSNPLSNGRLLDSLLTHHDRYTSGSPAVRSPDVIVVTGDIVRGISKEDKNNPDALPSQYREATDFLNDLASRLVKGDTQRVIIVPGNHDVDARQFRHSLTQISVNAGQSSRLAREMIGPGSAIRWSWSDLRFYKIDWSTYHRRFDAFRQFYCNFYEGNRVYTEDPADQFDVFDLSDYPVTFVGFNSCYNNDLLNRAGAINPECMTRASELLRHVIRRDNLAIAVWHHNTRGGPYEADYLDEENIQLMIDRGFNLGLHGHQHRPESLRTHFKYGADRKMIVVAAGTLCGNSPARYGCSYNIIELDLTRRHGRLHVYEEGNRVGGIPVWCTRALPSETQFYYDFELSPPQEHYNRKDIRILAEAQDAIERHDYETAVSSLSSIAQTNNVARRLLLECLIKTNGYKQIAELYDPPISVTETIHLMDALWETDRKDRLRTLISEPSVAGSQDQALNEIRSKYARRFRRSDDG